MTLADFFSNYAEIRKEMVDAVRDLTQEQLDWKPANHRNSIGYLLGHIAGCEYFWIEAVANKAAVTEEEFNQYENARTRDKLLPRLDTAFRFTMDYLESNTIEDWDDVTYEYVDEKGKRKTFTKRWLVWHVVEHQARHRGQIFMMMRMQGLDVPHV